MATIGRRAAVAKLPAASSCKGTLGWLAWLGLHLFYLVGFRNRLRVMINWTWRYFDWPSRPATHRRRRRDGRLGPGVDQARLEVVDLRRAGAPGKSVAELRVVLADERHLGAPLVDVDREQLGHVVATRRRAPRG